MYGVHFLTILSIILGNCKPCGCDWKKHMHITYEYHKFMSDVQLNSGGNNQSAIKAVEQRIKDLKFEQEQIIKVCSQLTEFLRVNALNPINDDMLEYIEHFIREERLKKSAGAHNESVIAGLEKALADYKREMDIVRQAMKTKATTLTSDSSGSADVIKQEEIFTLVGTLYRLPINGPKIQAQVNELRRIQSKFSRNREEIVNLPRKADSSSVMSNLREILK